MSPNTRDYHSHLIEKKDFNSNINNNLSKSMNNISTGINNSNSSESNSVNNTNSNNNSNKLSNSVEIKSTDNKIKNSINETKIENISIVDNNKEDKENKEKEINKNIAISNTNNINKIRKKTFNIPIFFDKNNLIPTDWHSEYYKIITKLPNIIKIEDVNEISEELFGLNKMYSMAILVKFYNKINNIPYSNPLTEQTIDKKKLEIKKEDFIR